jgi:hypothetical protein
MFDYYTKLEITPINVLFTVQTVNAEFALGSVCIKEEDDPEYTRGEFCKL